MYECFSISYFWKHIWYIWYLINCISYFFLLSSSKMNIIQYFNRITETYAFKTTMAFNSNGRLSMISFPRGHFTLWRKEQTHRPCVYSGIYVVYCSIGSNTVVCAIFEAFGDFTYFPVKDQSRFSDNISLHPADQDAGEENIRSLQAAGELYPTSLAGEWD